MQYWLFKSEPDTYGWQDMVSDGVTPWDGVRNYQARNYMKAMHVGDFGFFYHSVKEKRLVGIVRVVKPYYPDPEDATQRFGMVDVATHKELGAPVTLQTIKMMPELQDMPLVTQSRLSVMPVTPQQWDFLCQMSHTPWP